MLRVFLRRKPEQAISTGGFAFLQQAICKNGVAHLDKGSDTK